jgi:Mg2+ and Co2+ transporter CorA
MHLTQTDVKGIVFDMPNKENTRAMYLVILVVVLVIIAAYIWLYRS